MSVNKADEQVLVVPASIIEDLGLFSGFTRDVDRYLPAILDSKNQQFLPRSVCETDPSFKQLIPYLVLEDAVSNGKQGPIFRYTRGSGSTEARLRAKQSIGIGGHIAIEDCEGEDLYRTGMLRELHEEMIVPEIVSDEIVGLVYDDTTAVGTVHLGVVHRIRVQAVEVGPREEEVSLAGFVTLDEIASEFERLETWSQLVFTELFGTKNR